MLPFLKEIESASKTLAQSNMPEFQILPVLVLEDINVLLGVISKVSEIAAVSEIIVLRLSLQTSVSIHSPSKFGQSLFFLQEEKMQTKQTNRTEIIFMINYKRLLILAYKLQSLIQILTIGTN